MDLTGAGAHKKADLCVKVKQNSFTSKVVIKLCLNPKSEPESKQTETVRDIRANMTNGVGIRVVKITRFPSVPERLIPAEKHQIKEKRRQKLLIC